MIRINIEFDERDISGGAKKAVDSLVDFCKRISASSSWPTGVDVGEHKYTAEFVKAFNSSVVGKKPKAKRKGARS